MVCDNNISLIFVSCTWVQEYDFSFFSRDNNGNTKTKLYAVKCEFFPSNYQDIQCHKRKTRFEELFMTTPFFTLVI